MNLQMLFLPNDFAQKWATEIVLVSLLASSFLEIDVVELGMMMMVLLREGRMMSMVLPIAPKYKQMALVARIASEEESTALDRQECSVHSSLYSDDRANTAGLYSSFESEHSDSEKFKIEPSSIFRMSSSDNANAPTPYDCHFDTKKKHRHRMSLIYDSLQSTKILSKCFCYICILCSMFILSPFIPVDFTEHFYDFTYIKLKSVRCSLYSIKKF